MPSIHERHLASRNSGSGTPCLAKCTFCAYLSCACKQKVLPRLVKCVPCAFTQQQGCICSRKQRGGKKPEHGFQAMPALTRFIYTSGGSACSCSLMSGGLPLQLNLQPEGLAWITRIVCAVGSISRPAAVAAVSTASTLMCSISVVSTSTLPWHAQCSMAQASC
jgi:hypothetical protein